MPDAADFAFYESIEPFTDFREVADGSRYRAVPDGWLIGVADVVDSTGALRAGRYKAVNTVGASVIAAIMNLDRERPFPFVFGGDGAAVAVPGDLESRVRDALAACRTWAAEETGLELRAALVPIGAVRAAGHDLRIARFRPSPGVAYAMFSGGGLAWAEAEMKSGRFDVPSAAPGARPDFAGLSCRWKPFAARNGEILSLVVVPVSETKSEPFAALVQSVLDTLRAAGSRDGHPLTPEGPRFDWPPRGLALEACATCGRGRRWLRSLAILAEHLVPVVLELFGARLGRFDPARYRQELAQNSDFRKFDDGLKLTVDCDAATIDAIERLLRRAQDRNIARYGLHRQDSALMTCIVPSPLTHDHMHFIDGAAGGYAMAAEMLKQSVGNGR